MINTEIIRNVGELKAMIADAPDDMPIRTADHALASTYTVEIGELRVGDKSFLTVYPFEMDRKGI